MRVALFLGLSVFCSASLSYAADLPLNIKKAPPVVHKNHRVVTKKVAPAPQLVERVPAVVDVKPGSPEPKTTNDLSWVLGPMVANADGGKHEGSASARANIVVDAPGTNFGTDMVIELEGHVVKTIQATVRLDIQLGTLEKTVEWKADEVKAGMFKITLNEKVAAGTLPNLIPVSALAFVTQNGEGHAAMVSLEKIMLRFSKPQVVGTK